jgi:hypothetical protein
MAAAEYLCFCVVVMLKVKERGNEKPGYSRDPYHQSGCRICNEKNWE